MEPSIAGCGRTFDAYPGPFLLISGMFGMTLEDLGSSLNYMHDRANLAGLPKILHSV